MNLKESLESYRDITLELIDKVKADENFEDLFEMRQNIIENLESLNFTKDEFKELFISLGIFDIDNELKKAITQEKIKVKNKIDFIRKTREARGK